MLGEVKGHVQLCGVHFAYPSRKDVLVLQDVTLSLLPGEVVALVGPSGSGKSTLAALLLRLYDPTKGLMMLDGHDLRELSPEWLRQHVGIVAQEPLLFSCSVSENIRYGRTDATNEDVIAASTMANAHEFIMHTENGYQTNIGDRGIRLSGGQRQRLSIARAVFKNPAILILDEATSALDTESEKSVQDALENLMKGRTTLVIAHRLSTIKDADEILVMQDGEVVERGNHDELIEIDESIYKKLTLLQKIA